MAPLEQKQKTKRFLSTESYLTKLFLNRENNKESERIFIYGY